MSDTFDPTEYSASPRTPSHRVRKSYETVERERAEQWERLALERQAKLYLQWRAEQLERKALEREDKYTEDEVLEGMID